MAKFHWERDTRDFVPPEVERYFCYRNDGPEPVAVIGRDHDGTYFAEKLSDEDDGDNESLGSGYRSLHEAECCAHWNLALDGGQ